MFNTIKKLLVPQFLIIFLYSVIISLLNIYPAKFHVQTRSISLWEKRKSMPMCCVQFIPLYGCACGPVMADVFFEALALLTSVWCKSWNWSGPPSFEINMTDDLYLGRRRASATRHAEWVTLFVYLYVYYLCSIYLLRITIVIISLVYVLG